MPSRTAPLTELTPNPRNPRDDLGDLADLESIADIQLQPAVVVTKAAYPRALPHDAISDPLRCHQRMPPAGRRPQVRPHRPGHRRQRRHRPRPRHADLGLDRGERRPARLRRHRRSQSRRALGTECGSAVDAANRLRKTQAWVSQRRALLELAPQLQTALRRGELAIREARTLARVPLEEQVARWQAAQDKKNGTASATARPANVPPARRGSSPSALREFLSKPQLLADALRTHLGPDGVKTLLGGASRRTRDGLAPRRCRVT